MRFTWAYTVSRQEFDLMSRYESGSAQDHEAAGRVIGANRRPKSALVTVRHWRVRHRAF